MLNEKFKFKNCGIDDGSTIHLLLGLQGGMDPSSKLKEGINKKRIKKCHLTRMKNSVLNSLAENDLKSKREKYEEYYLQLVEEFSELKMRMYFCFCSLF